MRIEPMKVVVGIGAGVVDEVLEWQDEENDRTESFRNWTDWGRVGLCALGYMGQAFNFFPALAAPLAQSEVTLVTKSVSNAIRTRAGATSQVTRARSTAPRPSSSPGRVSWRPKAIS